MELTAYIERLHNDLMVAAAAGGDEAKALAERLTPALDSAARLMLLEALSAAAAEITRELAPGSVDLRLRGRDAEFVVTPPTVEAAPRADRARADASFTASASQDGDEGVTARVTLRLPDSLKSRIDEAASQAGFSANSWLVRAVADALNGGDRETENKGARGGQRFTGWVR